MSETRFPDLSPTMYLRVRLDQNALQLKFFGVHVTPTTGDDYVLLNAMSVEEKEELKNLSGGSASWKSTIESFYTDAQNPFVIEDSSTDAYDMLALSTGFSEGVGYVSLAMQNADSCSPLPVTLEVIRVRDELQRGAITVVKPNCPFDEILTLRMQGDFAGRPDLFTYEWRLASATESFPGAVDNLPDSYWDDWGAPFFVDGPQAGANEIQIDNSDMPRLLGDYFYVCRYQYNGDTDDLEAGLQWPLNWSPWSRPQLAEGWVKRGGW